MAVKTKAKEDTQLLPWSLCPIILFRQTLIFKGLGWSSTRIDISYPDFSTSCLPFPPQFFSLPAFYFRLPLTCLLKSPPCIFSSLFFLSSTIAQVRLRYGITSRPPGLVNASLFIPSVYPMCFMSGGYADPRSTKLTLPATWLALPETRLK